MQCRTVAGKRFLSVRIMLTTLKILRSAVAFCEGVNGQRMRT